MCEVMDIFVTFFKKLVVQIITVEQTIKCAKQFWWESTKQIENLQAKML
jgi:hypothetical protein